VGFYIRKSFRAGPYRLNLSKHGLGFSGGVKGFRVGAGPRGGYVNAGRKGVYYRKTFGGHRRRSGGHPFLSLLLLLIVLGAVIHFWKVLLTIAAVLAVVLIVGKLLQSWAARPLALPERDPSTPEVTPPESTGGEQLSAPPSELPPTPSTLRVEGGSHVRGVPSAFVAGFRNGLVAGFRNGLKGR
jgi:hypothetical protein